MTGRFGRACLDEWPLDAAVTYLNHGTVGVTPRVVLAAQRAIRDEVERAPSQVVLRRQSGLVGARDPDHPSQVRAAAAVVARFVGAQPGDLVFVDNVTTGINAVLRSLVLQPGDEILLTDHAYGGIAKAVHAIGGRVGAEVRTVAMPYPTYSSEALMARVRAALSPRTRLAVFDHVTAQSALILPVQVLAAVCRARGVPVLVDGAHAPGMVGLDLPALGVQWYAANLHKWACAPRSVGFLWAAPEVQQDLHAPVISWGFDQGFTAEFDWVGTRDVSAWLAAPAAIDYLDERGVSEAWAYNHGLAWQAGEHLVAEWGGVRPAGEGETGFMITVAAPAACGSTPEDATRLRDRLLADHAIEIQVHAGYGRVWVRVSAQVYNAFDDVERLAAAVLTESRR